MEKNPQMRAPVLRGAGKIKKAARLYRLMCRDTREGAETPNWQSFWGISA